MLSVVPCHHGKKGGRFGIKRCRCGLQLGGQRRGRAGWQPALAGQGGLPDVQQQPHPRADIGLTHGEQLPMHRLDGVLFELGQAEEQAIGRRGQGTVGVGDRPIAFAQVAIQCRVVEVAIHGQGKMRQEVGECGGIEAGKGA